MHDPAEQLRIVALEGIDGAGKSSVFERLHADPAYHGRFSFFAEFQSPLRETLKQEIRRRKNSYLKILLFAADRWHTMSDALEGREPSTWVIWDRYIWSALAYRSAEMALGRTGWPEISRELVEEVNRVFPVPQAVIYFDVPVDLALGRRRRAQDDASVQAKRQFLAEVAKQYEQLITAAKGHTRTFRVDASQEPDAVFQQVVRTLSQIEAA